MTLIAEINPFSYRYVWIARHILSIVLYCFSFNVVVLKIDVKKFVDREFV